MSFFSGPKPPLATLIDSLHERKNIPRLVLIDIIKQAMIKAAQEQFGRHRIIEAEYNEVRGEVDLYEFKTVVDTVEDPDTEIQFYDAKVLDPTLELGDSLGVILETAPLGRIPAQKAKQVLMQRIREAERDMLYDEFREQKGKVVNGIVRRFEKHSIIVTIGTAETQTEARLPKREQVRSEIYRSGEPIQVLIKDISRSTKNTEIILSRSSPDLLVRLFEREVPEISDGIVRIMHCAREPGVRAKIAVYSEDPNVDAVGACVGLKGSRVQAVVSALNNEAIDIIPFDENPAIFISNAISPAKVSRIIINHASGTMEVIVPDDQQSKAIGKGGQNVRLATKLTGWEINIISQDERDRLDAESYQELSRIPDIDDEQIERLIRHGYTRVNRFVDAEVEDISTVLEVSEQDARALMAEADLILDQLIEEDRIRRERKVSEDLPTEI